MFDFNRLSQELYSAVLSDVLDEFGLPSQAMRPFVRPLDDALVMMGPARTGLLAASYAVREGDNPYEIEIDLLDDLRPGDVSVLACNGPTDRIAPWGELLTTASRARGAVGCVTDGLVRDVRHIRGLNFPVFHGGIGPLDSKGRARMIERDIVFGDVDGVVVIPQQHASAVIERAQVKVNSENKTRDELKQGKYLRDVYAKYGVL